MMRKDEAADLIATSVPGFEQVSRSEIDWLLERGEIRIHATGDVIRMPGTTIDEMGMILAGRVGMYAERAGGWRRVIEVGIGYVMGAVPYSRMQTAPAKLVAEQTMTLFVLHQKYFRDLIVECPGVTAALVHQMLDRSREFRTLELHDERLLALGRLASGLAHELNNPASGASGAARALSSLLDRAEHAWRRLAAARLDDAQLDAIDRLGADCARVAPQRSALEEADREDAFTDWLERHGIDPRPAEALAATAATCPDALDALAAVVPGHAIADAIDCVAAVAAARDAARHIRTATARISELVDAVKGFTFMDRDGAPGQVDIARGLADTLAMLESKSSEKSVRLECDAPDALPSIWGYGSEINQVWQTLIDNAIDAVDPEGSVSITADAQDDGIIVRVSDDGPGIAEENRSRIFDPFFTTRPVGRGAGLGLYRARRIVERHRGDIDYSSRPGRTVFRVRLPITGASTARPEPAEGARRNGD